MRHLMFNTRAIETLGQPDRTRETILEKHELSKQELTKVTELNAVTRMIQADILIREMKLGYEHEIQMSKF